MICASPVLHAPANFNSEYEQKFLPWLTTFAGPSNTDPYANVAAAARNPNRCQLTGSFGSGIMWGSPWGGAPSYGLYTYDSNLARAIQHLFEDEIAATQNLNRQVAVWGSDSYGPETETIGRLKNGYQSQGYSAFYCDYGMSLSYYDDRYPGFRRVSQGYAANVYSQAL